MKIESSSRKPLLITALILIFGSIPILIVCSLIVVWQFALQMQSFQKAIAFPTFTRIPLPATLEEVRSTCAKGECLNACLAHANNELHKVSLSSYDYDGEEKDLVYYGISDEDELEKPRKFNVQNDLLYYQQDLEAHKAIWSYYKTLIPVERRPNLVTFGIYVSSDSLGTFDTTITENWITNINILALENADTLSHVVVHEYGHYLTLNTTQMYSDPEWGACKTPLYGCQTPDSYINLFYLQFWKEIYPEWKEIDYASDTYESEIDAFYNKYQDQFLDDYAATDPVEDIAESWEAFVLTPAPTGTSIADEKIKFFYRFPELVELRYQIINGICTFELK
jgi:hypothetical protein